MKRRVAQVVLALMALTFVGVIEVGMQQSGGWFAVGVFNGTLALLGLFVWAMGEVID